MHTRLIISLLGAGFFSQAAAALPLGLPPVPIPENNPQSPEKIALGNKLYHDAREKGFTDNLQVSRGFNGLAGTRNAPTVINAA